MDQWGLNSFMTQRFLLQRTIFMSPIVPRIIGNQIFPPFLPTPPPAIYLNNLKGEQGSISRRGSHGGKHSSAESGILTPKTLHYKVNSKGMFSSLLKFLTKSQEAPHLSFRTGNVKVKLSH